MNPAMSELTWRTIILLYLVNVQRNENNENDNLIRIWNFQFLIWKRQLLYRYNTLYIHTTGTYPVYSYIRLRVNIRGTGISTWTELTYMYLYKTWACERRTYKRHFIKGGDLRCVLQSIVLYTLQILIYTSILCIPYFPRPAD